MNEITVKTADFRIVGYIKEDANGNKTVTDFYRRLLGSYDADSDTVRDFYGKVIARGDVAAILLKDEF